MLFFHLALHLDGVIPHCGNNSQWRIHGDSCQIGAESLFLFAGQTMATDTSLMFENGGAPLGIPKLAHVSK